MKIELQPTIQIDTREQAPLVFRRFKSEVVGLPCGDYTLKGHGDFTNPQIIFERKSKGDLVGSLTTGRTRFLKEVELMRRFRWACIVIEASRGEIQEGAFRGAANPESILQTLLAIQTRAGVHLEWAGDSQGAAVFVEDAIRQYVRGLAKQLAPLLPAGVQIDVADMDKPRKKGVEVLFADGSTFADLQAEAGALA